jgi:hypothetical protein
VVAEGVEDQLAGNLLTQMGCDTLQGVLFSRPLSDERLEGGCWARTGVRSAMPGHDLPSVVSPDLSAGRPVSLRRPCVLERPTQSRMPLPWSVILVSGQNVPSTRRCEATDTVQA